MIENAHVTGGVFVDGSGSVDIENSTIDQGVVALGSHALRICGTMINGQLTIGFATGWILAGASADACSPNTVSSAVTLTYNYNGVQSYGNVISGTAFYYLNSGAGPSPPIRRREWANGSRVEG